jgi:DNA-binding NtrC family response regulator
MSTTLEHPTTNIGRRELSICVVGSESDPVQQTVSRLDKAGYTIEGTCNPQEALEKIRVGACRVLLADVEMPAMNGFVLLERALHFDPAVSVILVAQEYSVDSAIDAVKRGAHDFVRKPIDFARLSQTLDQLTERLATRSQVRELQDQLLSNLRFHGIIGKSPAMLDMFDMAQKVARHFTTVLVTGPTGSGKELVARALHQMSPVAQQRFAVCNCSAVVDTLLESQLFGHVRGSFTGASDTRAGLFEYANEGTVFLDEIGETSLSMQSKLLRVTQNREIQRVGSPEVKTVNVRMIAATHRDLRAEVLAGRFREDLFYRIGAVEIRVPGLTERPEDIPLLVQHFLKKYSDAYGKMLHGLSRRAQIVLLQHDWPGNVRELENVISSAALTTTNDFIDITDLPVHLQKPRARSGSTQDGWRPLPLEEIRRIHIQRVLEMCNGNRVRASQVLGIGRTSLYRYLKRASHQRPANGSVA